ncbi:MAG: type II toxin-antitoxin system CcdA family antitoxin [Nitrososphaerota archaeon]|nr:type II toxin-antitoxin system CcdA family antitoxin [Nitrososphaerota archaeon]
MKKCRKKNVVIYLDSEIVKEAKELGLNISKISENALKKMIDRIKDVDRDLI